MALPSGICMSEAILASQNSTYSSSISSLEARQSSGNSISVAFSSSPKVVYVLVTAATFDGSPPSYNGPLLNAYFVGLSYNYNLYCGVIGDNSYRYREYLIGIVSINGKNVSIMPANENVTKISVDIYAHF